MGVETDWLLPQCLSIVHGVCPTVTVSPTKQYAYVWQAARL